MDLSTVLVDHLLQTKREYKNLKKREIHDIFTQMYYIGFPGCFTDKNFTLSYMIFLIYQNELDKACFQYDRAYGYFKDLPRKTAFDRALRDKGFDIASNLKYDVYQRRLALMVYSFFDKTSGSSAAVKNEKYVKPRIT